MAVSPRQAVPRAAFAPPEAFRPTEAGYDLLPFRFLRWTADEVLVVSDVGEHTYLSATDFASFVRHRLAPDTASYADLKSKHFLRDTVSDAPIELLATKWRTRRSFLDGFTRLHLFVLTLGSLIGCVPSTACRARII